MCTVCTIGVLAGLAISRLLGIDDLVTSVWIGAFILSFSFVTVNWIDKRWPKIKAQRFQIPTVVLFYLLVLIPLKQNGSIGIFGNTLWGVDKILLGIIVGSIAFLTGIGADKLQRRLYKKIFFPFQKVIFPLLALIIASALFFIISYNPPR